jgi:hypothetical protein
MGSANSHRLTCESGSPSLWYPSASISPRTSLRCTESTRPAGPNWFEQQGRMMVHRARRGFVEQRTATLRIGIPNALTRPGRAACAMGRGLHDAKAPFRTHPGVNAAGCLQGADFASCSPLQIRPGAGLVPCRALLRVFEVPVRAYRSRSQGQPRGRERSSRTLEDLPNQPDTTAGAPHPGTSGRRRYLPRSYRSLQRALEIPLPRLERRISALRAAARDLQRVGLPRARLPEKQGAAHRPRAGGRAARAGGAGLHDRPRAPHAGTAVRPAPVIAELDEGAAV